MAVIKKSELQKMSAKDSEAKIEVLQRALLELEGEGKREKKKPLKKAIAKLKTRISMLAKKDLNTSSAPKIPTKKVNDK